jgi:hypothetical protein
MLDIKVAKRYQYLIKNTFLNIFQS